MDRLSNYGFESVLYLVEAVQQGDVPTETIG